VFYGVEKYRVNGVNNTLTNGHCLIVNNESDVISECGTGKNKNEVNLGMSTFLTHSLIAEVMEACKICGRDILEDSKYYYNSFLFYDGIIKNNMLTENLKKQFLFLNACEMTHELNEEFYYQISEQVLQFQYNIFKKLVGINKIKYSTRQEILKRVLIAKEIIHTSYLDNLDLNYIAKESSLSKYFLIKSFRQVFNITPHQYHLRLKINKAKELLIHEKNYAITEVASSLNYPDIYTFSKQFRNIMQCSPTEFRRRA
jgi:AraC-like DNA-binding protein